MELNAACSIWFNAGKLSVKSDACLGISYQSSHCYKEWCGRRGLSKDLCISTGIKESSIHMCNLENAFALEKKKKKKKYAGTFLIDCRAKL